MDPTRGNVNLGMGEIKVYGIGSRRLVYKEVVEVQSNYKKSYFWWFENPTCGDSAGRNQIEKDMMYLLDLFKGIGKKGHCDLVCGVPAVDDCVNAGLCWCLIQVSMILILWGAGPILRRGCGI